LSTASSRITRLVKYAREIPHFDPRGQHFGRMEMVLGLMHMIKRNRLLAFQHLSEARRLAEPFVRSSMLAEIDAALAELR
jgi:hypothetical protein